MACFYWLVVSAVGVLLAFILSAWLSKSIGFIEEENNVGEYVGNLVYWIVVLIFALSPLYFEFPNTWISRVATHENGKVEYHPVGKFCFEFSGTCFNVPSRDVVRIVSGVNPLTDNPKIRSVEYKVSVGIVNPDLFYKLPERRNLGTVDWNNLDFTHRYSTDRNIFLPRMLYGYIYGIVSEQIFEFNENFSKQLGAFYNPNNEEQKAVFAELIESQINTKVASEGLNVKFDHFRVKYI